MSSLSPAWVGKSHAMKSLPCTQCRKYWALSCSQQINVSTYIKNSNQRVPSDSLLGYLLLPWPLELGMCPELQDTQVWFHD